MEPKLRARRIEVARDQGRRRLRRVAAVIAVLAVVAGLVALTRSPVLDVDAVEVSGAQATGSDRVRAASGIELGTPMVSVDAGAAVAGIEELPWVQEASVERSWPATVEIRVVERTPVAVVGRGRSAVVVDARGRAVVAATEATGTDGLPTVAGDPVAVGEALAEHQRAGVRILAGMPEELAAEVAEVRATESGVVLVLVDEIEVSWGDSSQATAKAEALAVLLEQADRATMATIDLTVPRAATLTRKNGDN